MRWLKHHWWPLFVVGATLIALCLRVARHHASLDFDEWVTLRFTQLPWSEFWHYLRFENTPPLFFILEKLWAGIVGEQETALRILPLCFGVAWVPALALLARSVLRPLPSVFVLLLGAIAVEPLSESGLLRSYSLVLLLGTLLLWATIRWLQTKRDPWLITIGALGLLGVMTHLQFLIVVFGCQVAFLLSARRSYLRWCSAWLPAFLAISAWYVLVLRFHQTYSIGESWFNHNASSPLMQIVMWLKSMVYVFSHTPQWVVIVYALLLLLGGTLLVLGLLHARRAPHGTILLVVVVILSALTGILTNVIAVKYFIVAVPASFTLLGLGVQQLQPRVVRLGIPLLVLALVASQLWAVYAWSGFDWAATSTLLGPAGEQDLILVHPFPDAHVLGHYYRGAAHLEPLLPFQYRSDDAFADVMKYNYKAVLRPDTLDDLTELTAGYSAVYYVSSHVPTPSFFNDTLPIEWFDEHGWQGEQVSPFSGSTPLIIQYTRGE